jgi:hypothetical protein
MIELEPFKQYLITLLTEAREISKKANTNTVKAVIDGNIRLLEQITMFISKSIKEGEINMETAKSSIKVLDEGIIEAFGRARRESPITGKIIEMAKELKPGRYKQIDPNEIDPAHFTTRVYNLRSMGLVPMDVKPKSNVNGTDGLFLVKLTKEQMSAEPKKRQQKETA